MAEFERKVRKPRTPRTPGEVEERSAEVVAEVKPRYRRESAKVKAQEANPPAVDVVEKLNAEIEALASEAVNAINEVPTQKEEDTMDTANQTIPNEAYLDAKLQQANKWSWSKIAIAAGLGILAVSVVYRGQVNSREIQKLKALSQQ